MQWGRNVVERKSDSVSYQLTCFAAPNSPLEPTLAQTGFKVLPDTTSWAEYPLPDVLAVIHTESPENETPDCFLLLKLEFMPAQLPHLLWALRRLFPAPCAASPFSCLLFPLHICGTVGDLNGEISPTETSQGWIYRTAALWLSLAAALASLWNRSH